MEDRTMSRPAELIAGNEQSLAQVQRIAQNLLRIARRVGQHNRRRSLASDEKDKVRIVCVSDTHNTTPEIPNGDILVHAGDLTNHGTFRELQAQLDWLNTLPHQAKVVIGGNHDSLLDTAFVEMHPESSLGPHDKTPGQTKSHLNWDDIIYLEDGAVSLAVKTAKEGSHEKEEPWKRPEESDSLLAPERRLKIYGNPYTRREGGTYGFQYDEADAANYWANRVPTGTDILLTHSPPRGYLDNGAQGCPHLLREIWRVKPSVVVFGHVHKGHGEEVVVFDSVQRWYEETMATCSWASLAMLAFHTILARLRGLMEWYNGGAPREPSTHMVNAAVRSGKTKFEIITIDV